MFVRAERVEVGEWGELGMGMEEGEGSEMEEM